MVVLRIVNYWVYYIGVNCGSVSLAITIQYKFFFWDQTSSNHSIMIHPIHPCWDWHISCCLSEKKRGFIEALLLWMDGCDDPLQVGRPGKGSMFGALLSYGRMTAESLRVGLRHILTFLYFAGSLADFRSIYIIIYIYVCVYCRPYCLYLCFNIVYIHIIFIYTPFNSVTIIPFTSPPHHGPSWPLGAGVIGWRNCWKWSTMK
jgi:hypothetical protein